MKLRRRRLLVEPPGSATSDIAFTLIVFFLITASVQPDTGHPQDIPRSEEESEPTESKNVEVSITKQNLLLNSEIVEESRFEQRLTQLLAGKTEPGDRVVLVKSEKSTPYQRWIDITAKIENVGGIVTLQREQQQVITVD